MITVKKILIAALAAAALVPLWGYWYSSRHAYLNIHVNDYGLKTPTRLYGDPDGASLVLRDASNNQLAVARSVEPLAYMLAVHPDPAVGNCEHLKEPGEFADCYASYSRWSATWAPLVRTADVTIGTCTLRSVPVAIERSNEEWALWWVPLPHVGGLPRQSFNFAVAIDSRACAAVPPTVR